MKSDTHDPDVNTNAADLQTSVIAPSASGKLPASSIAVSLQEDGTAYWRGKVTATPTFAAEPGRLSFTFNLSVAQLTAGEDCKSPPHSIHPCLGDWQYLDQRISEVRVAFDRGTTSTKQPQYGNWTLPVPPAARRVVRLDAVLDGADILYTTSGGKTYASRPLTWTSGELASIALSTG